MLDDCQHSPAGSNIGGGPAAKIKIRRDGVVSLDDKAVSLDELKAALSKLKQSPGSSVWYYRENPAGEPHPNAMQVLKLIVDAKLPIRLSTKPDFSDFVGADGRPHPVR
jgi:C-terminal processing protease CtpA/Prc